MITIIPWWLWLAIAALMFIFMPWKWAVAVMGIWFLLANIAP